MKTHTNRLRREIEKRFEKERQALKREHKIGELSTRAFNCFIAECNAMYDVVDYCFEKFAPSSKGT